MVSDTNGPASAADLEPEEDISLSAIACCPAALERCLCRLLDLLGAYWEEFRQPRESALVPACNGFTSAARASLRRGEAAPWPSCDGPVPPEDPRATQDADRFIDVLDHVIRARHESNGGIEMAVDALKLASSLVREMPWGGLPERALAQNYDLLKWTLRRIGSSRKGWNDKNYARLLRKLIRVDPTILKDLIKEYG